MRVMLLGDVHANFDHFVQVAKTAKAEGCEYILQVGDFGYWEHTRSGAGYLRAVERDLTQRNIVVIWVDGNHENHAMLRAEYEPGPDGFVRVRPHIWYAPRGHRFELEGVSFLAVGGAHSIDQEWRKEGISWWPEEMLTDDEVARCIEGGRVDVILSHDAPDGVDVPALRATDKNRFPQTIENRQRLRQVVQATRPAVLVHGHYHCRYSDVLAVPFQDEDGDLAWWQCSIVGLASDQEGGGSALVATVAPPGLTTA